MRRIKDKLYDNRGVTILMALFALLVASMVCIVILGASVTTVKQSKEDQQHEQDMLLLQSAGELIGSNIGNGAVEVTYKTITTETKESGKPPSTNIQKIGPKVTKGNCLIRPELETAVAEIINEPQQDYASTKPFSIDLTQSSLVNGAEGQASSSLITDVNGASVRTDYVLRCGSHNIQEVGTGLDYQLVFTFSLIRPGEDTPCQSLHMKMAGTRDHTETTDTPTDNTGIKTTVTTVTDTYSWGKPEFYVENRQEV